MEAFLSCIIFWNLGKIESFWKELSEILQHVPLDKADANKKLLNKQFKKTLTKFTNDNLYLITSSLVGDPEVNFNDWVDRLNDKDKKLAEYLELTTRERKQYDGKSFEELLRAYRNSSTHRYGSSVFNLNTNDLSILKYGQQKFSDGGVRCFLEIFPEFLLLTYHLGYCVSSHLEKFLGESPIKHRFYSSLSNDQVDQIPNNLSDFAASFIDKIHQEMKTPSELWTYSVTLEGGSSIQFFRNNPPAKKSTLQLSQREFLALKFELLGKKLKGIRLLRSTISNDDELQCLLNQGDVKKLPCLQATKETSIELKAVSSKNNFKHLTESIPICIFTDIISAAFAYVLNFATKQQFVVFSNQSASQIDYVTKQFLVNCRISLENVCIHDLTWNELNERYKQTLLSKRIPLHVNSKVTFTLEEISGKNQHFLNILRGNQLSEITHPHNLCLLNHDVPEVICYISRSLRSLDIVAFEDYFLENWLLRDNNRTKSTKKRNKHRYTKRHQVFYITSIAGMGKSTFLAKIGDKLCRTKSLVKFIKAKLLSHQISENTSSKKGLGDLLKSIWPKSEFDHAVVKYILANGKAPFQLLIDGFDELPNNNDRNKIIDLIRDLFKLCSNSDINAIITTRTKFIDMKKDIGVWEVFTFEIAELSYDDKIECICSVWEQRIGKSKDKTQLEGIISKCLQSCDELGEFGSTPFACEIVAKAYETYAQDVKDFDDAKLLNAFQLYERFITDTLLEDFAKCVQKPCTPEHSIINTNTVDSTSLPFREYNDSLTRYNCFQSFRLRFPSLNGDLCASLESALHASNFDNTRYKLDNNTLIEGTLADFHAAKFIFDLNIENRHASLVDTLIQFVFDNAFDLEDDQFKFQYDNIIRLFNSYLKLGGKDARVFQGKALTNVHMKLYTALHLRYYCLFVSIIDNVDTNVYQGAECWLNMTGEMKKEAVPILHQAIQDNKLNVIKYLLETVHINVDFPHPLTENTALHCAILHKVSDDVVNCVLEQNPQIFTVKNGKGLVPIEYALQHYQYTDNGFKTIFGHAKKLEIEYKEWETAIKDKQHLPLELTQKCRNLKAITF